MIEILYYAISKAWCSRVGGGPRVVVSSLPLPFKLELVVRFPVSTKWVQNICITFIQCRPNVFDVCPSRRYDRFVDPNVRGAERRGYSDLRIYPN